MSSIIVLRHAKARTPAGVPDDLRPLSRRGRRDAGQLGRFLRRLNALPDAAICSPSKRTLETMEALMKKGDWSCPVREAAGLYVGGLSGLLAELRREPDGTGRLLVVGHEPTCSDAVHHLTGGRVVLPTGGMCLIELEDDRLSQATAGSGALAWLVTPATVGARRA